MSTSSIVPEAERRRHRHGGKERRQKTHSGPSALGLKSPPANPRDLQALRTARLAYLSIPWQQRQRRMKYVGEVVEKASVRRKESESLKKSSAPRRRHKATESGKKHSHPRPRSPEQNDEDTDQDGDDFVYPRVPERKSSRGAEDSTTVVSSTTTVKPESPRRSRAQRSSTVERKVIREKTIKEERRTPRRRQSDPVKRRNSYGIDECAGKNTSSPRTSPPKRTASAADRSHPPLPRSATSARSKLETASSVSNAPTDHVRKPSSIFSRLMPAPPVPTKEKKISCLTCGDDEVPMCRSAKLACSHRMCHDCLKRIFKMSLTDPAHMPPRCCTSDHIPLKHVDKLFDLNFKKTWNRKFEEYKSRNRIYCPARGCGEWIKPNHISIEHGRKIGKCKKCGMKVCGTCNNKLHSSRECPKDPATLQFVEVAKQKGWQKCYKCKAMVELKEGCNHMTCRCTAEFCMVCGLKWKSCDCPWFNYENVDAHLGNPIRYQEELDRRRQQEARDERIARRMEILSVHDEDDEVIPVGVGNAAGHHMNDDFFMRARDILAGNMRHAARAAEDLINGHVTGRENPLPGLPLPRNETHRLLRQQSDRRSPEVVPLPAPIRRPGTERARRPSDTAGRPRNAASRDGENTIENWRLEVPVGDSGRDL